MKITAIKQQVKRADRYSVYIDDVYSFALSDSELLRLGIYSGQELSVTDLAGLKDNSVRDKARSQALNQLARRQRSEWELRDYLKRKEHPPEVIDFVISWLAEYGYVDDTKFAAAWVANRRLLKPISTRRLRQELQQKRVPSEVIDQVLAEDQTDEHKVLRNLIERKRRQTKYQDNLKLLQYLARQGFSYEGIKSALQDRD